MRWHTLPDEGEQKTTRRCRDCNAELDRSGNYYRCKGCWHRTMEVVDWSDIAEFSGLKGRVTPGSFKVQAK